MNQIICTNSSNIEFSNNKLKKKYFYKFQFYILILITAILVIYYVFFRYSLYKSEKIATELIDNFNIATLYSDNSLYTADLVNKDIYFYKGNNFSVIGIIKIPKLNIVYPISSEISNNLLKVATCRFYGPNPNEVGNLCIAAHNYKNDSFFSNLHLLSNGDLITIGDTNGIFLDYMVYDTYKSDSTNLDCINQNTNNKKIVTLITCNRFDNHYRTIIKAEAIQ